MLAMVVQTTRAFRQPMSSFTTIASMLAPTGMGEEGHVSHCIRTAPGYRLAPITPTANTVPIHPLD
jgi:hypothetical protein